MADVDILSVREVTAADREMWLFLWRQWQQHMHGAVPEDVSARTWLDFLDPQKDLHALLAMRNEVPLGFANVSFTPFAWTGSAVAFLQDLFVTPDARGQGIGSHLLEATYQLADRLGASQVFWMVDETDEELQAFYARHAIRTPYLRYMRNAWPW